MIVFLTLYLGLISGKQPVALQADAAVKSIRIVVDGANVATMNAAPWRTEVDFGAALLPHEIVAIALDGNGAEIARASQLVNVPRSPAEIDVVLTRNAEGVPTRAKLVGRHLGQQGPRSATLKLDETSVAVGTTLEAALPAVDMRRPHVLAAEMRFTDDVAARRELVFGGQFAESTQTQLTPVAVARTGASDAPPAEGCFAMKGAPLQVRSVEPSSALVIVVRDPESREINKRLGNKPPNVGPSPVMLDAGLDVYRVPRQATTRVVDDGRTIATLDKETSLQLLSSVANSGSARTETMLFPISPPFSAAKTGLYFLLTRPQMAARLNASRQWADAVAVAGVRAAAGGRRRAVVLVLGSGADKSDHPPAAVRAYLASIGVPLFVWSPNGKRPDLAASWGEMEDVSSTAKLAEAADRLRHALDTQRIAWIEADPLTALRAEIKDGCGYARLAR